MKKTIAVVALDPRTAVFYTDEVKSLFGAYTNITSYSVRDGSATGKLPPADLFVISTDAYDSAEEVSQHVPIDCPVMAIEVSYRKRALAKLREIPKGTRILFVNMTKIMTQEAIAQLAQLGVNHLDFVPFYEGAVLKEPLKSAVTLNEARFVPQEVKKIIDLDHRSISSSTMIEIALRLGLDQLLETKPFQDYFESMATSDYSFNQMYAQSRKLESQFHILMEILDEGIIGVNGQGEIFACNKKACQIAKVSKQLILGHRGEEVFPFLPFYRVLKERQEAPARVITLYGVNVNVAVMPVLRHEECIGAFATLQRFNEVESKQNALRSQLLQKGHYAKYTFADVLGDSPCIARTREILTRMAATDSAVLIVGETGTGKELLAHAVHAASKRKAGPFLAINVAAMPENLLESELFGYAEGAFTGAKKGGHPGLFEFAQHGTIFLDELEGMSPAMQVKLLRVLQEGEVMRVGGSSIVQVDVRVVAATNESIEAQVAEGKFRKDLYYRLNALTVVVPPLRERGSDILLLLEKFRQDLQGSFTLSEETKEFLLHYDWPGNIRELRNAAEYFIFTGQEQIGLKDLPPTMQTAKLKPGPLLGLKPAAEVPLKAEGEPEPRNLTKVQALPGVPAEAEVIPVQTGTGTRRAPPLFVLEELVLAAERGESTGREKILQAAHSQHLLLSQKQVRDILQKLEREGLIIVGRGRGGSKLTPQGEFYWQQQAGNQVKK